MSASKIFVASMIALALMAGSASAMADSSSWTKTHPRRVEVNNRIQHQNHRIRHEVKEGDLSKQQAAKLHHHERQIRHEERVMAKQHHGHLTKAEQAKLNRQLNRTSHHIGH